MIQDNNLIHPSVIISPKAKIAANVKIGPFCIIGDDVQIAQNVELKSHVVIDCPTEIGEGTVIYPFASINEAQDLKYKGENSKVIIGKNNVIREYVTIQRGTKQGAMLTEIGDNNLLMLGVHVAHDCRVGSNTIIANNVGLAGHVEVGDYAVIGGHAGVQQFVRIGAHAMIGGMSKIINDVIPFGLASNQSHAQLEGLNLVGMKRRGFNKSQTLEALAAVKDLLSDAEGLLFSDRFKSFKNNYNNPIIQDIVEFIEFDISRNLCNMDR